MAKKSLLFGCLMCFVNLVCGQTTYSVLPIPYNPDPFTTGDTLLEIDDFFSAPVQLPFSFCFFDSTFDKLLVGTNGVISFDLSDSIGFCPWVINDSSPSPSIPDLWIMGTWHDLDMSTGQGYTRFETRGIAPYRRFVVSFVDQGYFSTFNLPNCDSLSFTQQIILFETTNCIEVHIQDKPVCTVWNNGAAIQGLEYNDSTSCVVPGRNFPAQWTAYNDAVRFTPQGACFGPQQTNQVSGRVFHDLNSNCLYDAGEIVLAHRPVLVNGGAYFGWTNVAGEYSIPVDTGSWTLTCPPPLYWTSDCPASGSYAQVFNTYNNSIGNLNFSDSMLVSCPDLWTDIGTPNLTRCLTEIATVTYCNQGTQTDPSAVITVTLDDSLSVDSASVPFVQLAGNVYQFSVGPVAPTQCGTIQLFISVGCGTPGDIYCMEATIAGSFGSDCNTANDSSADCHPLTGSFDPNEKYSATSPFQQLGWTRGSQIRSTDELNYMITFQNTGNDTAFHVRIIDTLSSYHSPVTLIPGAGSSVYDWLVIGNVLIVDFPQINLPDSNTNEAASHGFIKFRINQAPGNTDGDTILNRASIYFDQNWPILTGYTQNIICDHPEFSAFSYTTTNGTVTFTDGSSNATSWAWDFGDQGTSSQQSPVHTYTSSGTYTVMLIVTGPCGSDTSTQSVTVLITDVASAFAGAVKLYPNPNAGSFRVEVPSFAGRVEIEVSDLSGRVIHRQAGEGSTEVNLSAGKGYYLLRVRSGEMSHTLPVVVE